MAKLIGLMLTRDSDWIIGFTLRAALRWVDEMVVMLHNCNDKTDQIVNEIASANPDRILIHHVIDANWNEMLHRQQTLEFGRQRGGTHFAIIDDDEALTCNQLKATREAVLALAPHETLTTPMIPVWRSLGQRRVDDCPWSRAILSLAFADGPGVTWMPAHDGYQFHSRFPRATTKKRDPRRETQMMSRMRRQRMAKQPVVDHSNGGAFHYQFASWKRLRAKHVWYRMIEMVMYPGRKTPEQINEMYSLALNEDGLRLETIPSEWKDGYDDIIGYADIEKTPWHLAECRRMMLEHGPEKFAGLDLLGLV